ARSMGLPVKLIDREVGLTFRRAMQRLGWWGRAKTGAGILLAMFGDEEVGDDEIEKLKQGDMLEASFGEFASHSPALYETVIAERDRYMANPVRQKGDTRNVLAVVDAGHLPGLARHMAEDQDEPAQVLGELETVREKSGFPWMETIIGAFLLGGFGWGIWQGGLDVGADLLLQWVLATGLL